MGLCSPLDPVLDIVNMVPSNLEGATEFILILPRYAL